MQRSYSSSALPDSPMTDAVSIDTSRMHHVTEHTRMQALKEERTWVPRTDRDRVHAGVVQHGIPHATAGNVQTTVKEGTVSSEATVSRQTTAYKETTTPQEHTVKDTIAYHNATDTATNPFAEWRKVTPPLKVRRRNSTGARPRARVTLDDEDDLPLSARATATRKSQGALLRASTADSAPEYKRHADTSSGRPAIPALLQRSATGTLSRDTQDVSLATLATGGSNDNVVLGSDVKHSLTAIQQGMRAMQVQDTNPNATNAVEVRCSCCCCDCVALLDPDLTNNAHRMHLLRKSRNPLDKVMKQ